MPAPADEADVLAATDEVRAAKLAYQAAAKRREVLVKQQKEALIDEAKALKALRLATRKLKRTAEGDE